MQDVHGRFEDHERAEAAVQALLDRGFRSDDIRVTERRGGGEQKAPVVWGTYTTRWGVLGAVLGAVAGAVLAPILRQVERPALQEGLDRLLSAEGWPIVLQGAFLGAIAAGVIGATIGIGTWRNHAKVHDDAGRVWVGVRTNQGELERATDALRQEGARELDGSQRTT